MSEALTVKKDERAQRVVDIVKGILADIAGEHAEAHAAATMVEFISNYVSP